MPSIGKVSKHAGANRAHEILSILVDKLGTELASPEFTVINQDDPYDENGQNWMYFLGKGQCMVNVRDQNGIEHDGIRVLNEGDHFGEIGLIFKCQRSASVVCRNYNTLARLQSARYRELVAEYPEYEECMKEYIRTKYKDDKIIFLIEMLKRVDYLRDVSEEIIYEIMFSLQPRQFEKDSIVLQEDANAGSVQFLEQGVIEVFT